MGTGALEGHAEGDRQPGAFTGGTDVKNDAALGAGRMDLPAILTPANRQV